MEVVATEPAPGVRVPAGASLTATVRLSGGQGAEGLALLLDGEDVTARCAVRVDLAHPPRRADLVLPGLPPGDHEAVVRWPSPPGAHAWRFSVGGTEDHAEGRRDDG